MSVENAVEDVAHLSSVTADKLLPVVYGELRALAAQRLAREQPGHTLQPTALVHEAYLRLVGKDLTFEWEGCGHFFSAAAEAMRRILVERARRKQATKHGGGMRRRDLLPEDGSESQDHELLAMDESLERLASIDPTAAELVKLRFFAGLPVEQIAQTLSMSERTARRKWAFARAWLRREMVDST